MSAPDDLGPQAVWRTARALEPTSDGWLERFHAGDRVILARCYRDYYPAVERSVARVLAGADLENVVHEVFYRLLSSDQVRASFRGGSFASWITMVARNQAIDFARHRRHER